MSDHEHAHAPGHDHGHGHDHKHGHDHGHDHDHDKGQAGKSHEKHGHAHGAGHSHHHHSHASERRLSIALAITIAFMLVEAIGGWIAGSLALVADALHMLTDGGSLLLAIFALRVGRRTASERYSYGHQRYEVLAAFVNGLALLLLSAGILFAAAQRLVAPGAIDSYTMLITASLGFAANIAGFFVLRETGDSLNMRAALLHVIGDLIGSGATIAAAVVILLTGWTPIDTLLSVVVALLIVRGGWNISRQSAHILLEGAPTGLDIKEVGRELVASDIGVDSVHHVHAWSITGEKPMMTLHAVLSEQADRARALGAIQSVLRERFGVEHATVQIEQDECAEDAGHSRCA